MNERILICIPCHNRKRIAELCVKTVSDSIMRGTDTLELYDDGSTEHSEALMNLSDIAYLRPMPIGIEMQRKQHFASFVNANNDGGRFTHLYLTDSDAIHDPSWRRIALELQAEHGGVPVCLYNTEAHSRLIGNTIEDNASSDVIWRRVAPGISYFLTAEHVAKVVAALPGLPDHWSWDWTVPAILGSRFAISRTSYVDHIGYQGYHHPENEGYDGGDRATNPTRFLIEKRAEIVAKLQSA